jgi:DNA polymerase III subunit epsilon
MIVLVFDSETTGLLPPKQTSITETWRFPRIVQLSWMLFDMGTNRIAKLRDYIIKMPNNYKIPKSSSKIHGITTEISKKKGTPIKDVLDEFAQDLFKCKIIVAHNITFDKRMVEVEFVRNKFGSIFQNLRKAEYCTMKKGVPICKLTMQSYYEDKLIPKFPKLSELHEKLFSNVPKNIHNSLIDILMCFRCYYKMNYECDVMDTNPAFARLFKATCKF